MTDAPRALDPELDRALAGLLPSDVAAFAATGGEPTTPLLPQERGALEGMSPARRAEFTLGRSCARAALHALGEPEHAIPRRPDRGPRWPPGITGSLSHTEGLCIAVVAHQQRVRALGVDVEKRAPRHPRALERIATRAERGQLEELAHRSPEIEWSKLLFSAKESVYKAQFPLAGIALGFHDVSITLEPGGTFSAEVGDKVPRQRRARGEGTFANASGYAITLFVVRPTPAD